MREPCGPVTRAARVPSLTGVNSPHLVERAHAGHRGARAREGAETQLERLAAFGARVEVHVRTRRVQGCSRARAATVAPEPGRARRSHEQRAQGLLLRPHRHGTSTTIHDSYSLGGRHTITENGAPERFVERNTSRSPGRTSGSVPAITRTKGL
jgi:hypothetical protein